MGQNVRTYTRTQHGSDKVVTVTGEVTRSFNDRKAIGFVVYRLGRTELSFTSPFKCTM